MQAILARLADEPVLLTGLVGAVLNFVIIFGIDIDPDTKTKLVTAIDGVLLFFARSKVTPV